MAFDLVTAGLTMRGLQAVAPDRTVFVGVDLGQMQSHSAVVVVELLAPGQGGTIFAGPVGANGSIRARRTHLDVDGRNRYRPPLARLFSPLKIALRDEATSRAVSRNRNVGRLRVLRVRLDGFDHQIKLVGAVDFPGHAPVLVGRDDLGFIKVVQPINAASRIISHDEHDTRTVLRPREQKQMIGAEVEHRGKE